MLSSLCTCRSAPGEQALWGLTDTLPYRQHIVLCFPRSQMHMLVHLGPRNLLHDSCCCRVRAHSCTVRLLCAYSCGCWLLQMGIANRDIKLENTLLMDLSERPVLKLCDFGYSKDELCASISKTMCGKQALLPN